MLVRHDFPYLIRSVAFRYANRGAKPSASKRMLGTESPSPCRAQPPLGAQFDRKAFRARACEAALARNGRCDFFALEAAGHRDAEAARSSRSLQHAGGREGDQAVMIMGVGQIER